MLTDRDLETRLAGTWNLETYPDRTKNQNYKAEAHRDKGNIGESFLVAFGDFTGGELEIHEGPLKGLHDVRTPMVTDFRKVLHSVKDFVGTRYSLVFYTDQEKDAIVVPLTFSSCK
jgi:hypothetical protein